MVYPSEIRGGGSDMQGQYVYFHEIVIIFLCVLGAFVLVGVITK